METDKTNKRVKQRRKKRARECKGQREREGEDSGEQLCRKKYIYAECNENKL